MGNCFQRAEGGDKVEVVPPSERGMRLPKFKDTDQFKVPKIINRRSVKACFKKNLTPVDLPRGQEGTAMVSTESE